jgi:DtxR family Mn-dependent transcriptional regulator
LIYLNKIGLTLGSKIEILEIMEYDQSMELLINESNKVFMSKEISKNIYLNKA